MNDVSLGIDHRKTYPYCFFVLETWLSPEALLLPAMLQVGEFSLTELRCDKR